MSNKVAFISGHRDVTEEEFVEHYQPKIVDAMMDGCSFVVGDCEGVDYMAQKFLESLLESVCAPVTIVFHMCEAPRYFVEGFSKSGGFKSDVDRDFAMTIISDFDIAWIREGKERSGTAQNIERRKLKESGVTDIQEVMTLEASMFL